MNKKDFHISERGLFVIFLVSALILSTIFFFINRYIGLGFVAGFASSVISINWIEHRK